MVRVSLPYMDLAQFQAWKSEPADSPTKAPLFRKLVGDNRYLVVHLVTKYGKGREAEWEDLIQSGTFGLIRAIELYDPVKARFSTYAATWIAKTAGLYRTLPVGITKKIIRAAEAFMAQHGKAPTSADLGLKPGVWENAEVAPREVTMDEAFGADPRGRENGWEDRIPDPNGEDPETALAGRELTALLETSLADCLTKHQRIAILMWADGDPDATIRRTLSLESDASARALWTSALEALKAEFGQS